MSSRPKLIVTGLAGLLGSRLVALGAGRFDFINVDLATGIDITDADQLRAAIEPHSDALAILHLAAFTNVSAAHAEANDEAGPCFRINVIGTRNVAEIASRTGLHLIQVSTDFVFDGTKDDPYVESDPLSPIEWYGHTKALSEQAARGAPSWTIARLAFPYVAGTSPRPDLVRNIRTKLAAGEPAFLFSDQVITPTFADDIARALLLLAQFPTPGEIFHVVGSTWLSPFELGQKIAGVFGFDPALVRASSMAEYLKNDPRPRQRSLKMSCAKWSVFAREHGVSPPLSIDEGLALVRREATSPSAS